MKKCFLNISLFLLVGISYSFAQFSIKGSIVSDGEEAISYANIVLLESKDSTYIKGTVSGENGQFDWVQVPKGSYILQVSSLGFTDYFRFFELESNLDFGKILLKESSALLNEVTVSAKRKLITKKIDRLVFDVENSSKSTQGDALDVLSVTPGIQVRNDVVNMIGKSRAVVMINDKIIRLTGEELSNYLRSIASSNIKKIEVITVPPSKYDAEGNSGLINIQLKKAKADSWSASVFGDFRQRKNQRYAGGAGFNYNKNKLSIASSFYYQGGIYHQTQIDETFFPSGRWFSDSSFDRAFDQPSAQIDIAYELTPKWSIAGQYIYSFSDQHTTEKPYTDVFDYETNKIQQQLNTNGNIDQLRHIHSFNLNNQFKLDSLGKKLSISLDYFDFDDRENKKYDGTSLFPQLNTQQFYKGENINDQTINNASAAVDFEWPSKWAAFEFGGKYTRSQSSNDIDFFNSGLKNDPLINLPLTKNDLSYNENILAAYVSARKELSKKLTLQVGLRMEATESLAQSENLNFSRENNYVKLFPTFYLSYTAKENLTYNFSYNKRISRAPFYMLTPNPWFSNPFQYVVGNPFLQPSFSDNFELSAVYKNLSVSAYYNLEKDYFTQVPIATPEENIMEYKFENFLDIQRFGINLNHTFDKIKWWSSSNGINLSYNLNSYFNEGITNTKIGYASTLSTNNDFVLNKAKTISLNVSYWYNLPGVEEFWDKKAMSNLSTSLQFLLLKKKLKLVLRANDIFKTQRDQYFGSLDGVTQEVLLYYDSRYIGVVINYSFGNNNISTKKSKVGNQAERNRAGRF